MTKPRQAAPGDVNARGYVAVVNTLLAPATEAGPEIVDLFSGAGGLSLGFRAWGSRVQGFDSDRHAGATYEENVGPCTVEPLTLDSVFPRTDVLVAGPPCQPFSVAGMQAGEDDARDGLLPIVVSAIRQTRPEVFIIENVSGLNKRNRPYLGRVISQLEQLEYVVAVQELNAHDYGVPQRRHRLFVVGHRGGFAFPERLPVRINVRAAIGRSATRQAMGTRAVTPRMEDYILRYERASGCSTPRDIALDAPSRTLTTAKPLRRNW